MHHLLKILFPSQCIICKSYFKPIKKYKIDKTSFFFDKRKKINIFFAHLICKNCLEDFLLIEEPVCIKCGSPFQNKDIKEHICLVCTKKKSQINTIRAYCVFDKSTIPLIHLFKYNNKTKLGLPMSFMIFHLFLKYRILYKEIDIIIPVPLHIKKARHRGFNQSFQILRYWKNFFKFFNDFQKIQIDNKNFTRKKHTQSQTNFNVAQRKKNVQGVFEYLEPKKIKNKNILLIDDVYTTGATSEEATKTLLKAGAKKVDVIVFAKTIKE